MDRIIFPNPFTKVAKKNYGPWFKEYMVEDDGLEYYYKFKNDSGETKYLLSNNVPHKDRQAMERLYLDYRRSQKLCTVGGIWAGFEIVSRVPYLRRMAYGWRFLAFLGIGAVMTEEFKWFTSGYYYAPMLNAYYKKYEHHAKQDMFDIRDEKREWFELDTSQYMNYSFDDLDHHHHNVNHGPQPDGEALDSSWFVEMDKYLQGKPNKLKEHPKYKDYKFNYSNKYQWPSTDLVHSVFHAAEKEQHTPESLKPGHIDVKRE